MKKTMKKILCTVLVVVLCLTSAPLGGFVGLELPEWNFLANAGSPYSYTVENGEAIITDYWWNPQHLVVPNTVDGYRVTGIGSYAFDNKALESIILPDDITTIGYSAFAGCTKLTSITLPSNLEYIGVNAFMGCTSLEELELPNNVMTIEYLAFQGCTNLESISIPDSVTTIDDNAFNKCTNLKNITVGANNQYYSSDVSGTLYNKDKTVFIKYPSGKTATSYTISNSVISIGSHAFSDCKNLKNIIIPDSVTTIDDDAFNDCTTLANITIPDYVTSIGSGAFEDCINLVDITIPDSVTSIGSGAFVNCTSLTSINLPDSITEIADSMFFGCSNIKNITIPNSVTHISDAAFRNCTSLKKLIIPDSVKSIYDYAFSGCTSLESMAIPYNVVDLGIQIFMGCTNLKTISVHKNNPKYSSDAGVLFDLEKTSLIKYPEGSTRTKYTIPSSVTDVYSKAFYSCTNLKNIIIPDSVITIYDDAFLDCNNMTDISVNENNKNYSSDKYGVFFNKEKTELLQYPKGNSRISYTIPDSVKTIGKRSFENSKNLKSISISDSVTKISDYAFHNCINLSDIYYTGTEEQWRKISKGSLIFYKTNAAIHNNLSDADNSTGPSDNPNSGDNLNKVTINFTSDTYEVEADETVTVSATVTCPAGVENSNLDMVWEVIDPDGTEIVLEGEYSRSETEWACYAEIRGLKGGTYYINLRDNNSTVFDTVRIDVYEYYHPQTPPKPHIDCDDTTVEYKQNVDFDKRKKFTINGEITNYNEEHTLTDISITIKSPDANKAVFKTDNGYEASVTFPLGKTIEVGKARDFKCTAYIKRGYNPPNGTEDLTFTCILHGKLDGKEINGVYRTFNVKIKNLSYESPDDKNWTPTSLIGLLDILFTGKTPKGNLYIDCYPNKSAASTLKWQYTSIKATNAVTSTIKLSEELSKALDVAIKLTETGNISAVKIQDKIFGLAEKALNKVMDAYKDKAMNEIQKFYDGEIKRLLESKEYKEYLEWYSREVNYINGNSTKVTKRCPIDIYVTDEEGYRILQITGSDIEVFDEYAAAYLSGDDKILYLPNDIGHSIKTVATDNGEMDYIIESYSKQGEYRIIEYDNIPLTKGKSYTATVPLDMTSNIEMFNPKSEDGKIIKADKDETEHRYGDKDKNCQLCGYDRTQGCSCNCHKGGIAKFFFNFILFFQKIFKTNKTCSCGVNHY